MKKVSYNIQKIKRERAKRLLRIKRILYLILLGGLILLSAYEVGNRSSRISKANAPVLNDMAQEVQTPQLKINDKPEPTVAPQKKVDFNKSNYATKKKLIIERLKYNKVSNRDIKTFVSIFELESCRNKNDSGCFNTRKTPKTIVYHCQRPDGSRTAIEIISKNGVKVQAHCSDYGYKTTYQEQSIGLAQILVTTWKGHKCKGDIYKSDYKQQVDCAVRIQRISGFTQWSTFKYIGK